MIPDEKQALALHRKLGSTEKVIQHCLTVAKISRDLSESFCEKGISLDEKSVIAAGLLHDIGRSQVQTVKHGYVGAEIARKNGVDESVATIIMRHVGAGIDREEALKYGLPPNYDYFPRTLEEKIVCFSDKVAGPQGEVLPLEHEIEKYKRKGLDYRRLVALKKSLEDILGEDPEVAIHEKLDER